MAYKSMIKCVESLVARLETIRETNPEIHLDDDIRKAKDLVAEHRAKFLEMMGIEL